jgi:glycosyltransferase involved in cell wall biosynthesis
MVMKPSVLVDARCLQHPGFARRGIGLHIAAMLGAEPARHFDITLLFDPELPPPAPDLAARGDHATTTAYAASRRGAMFLQPAPFSFPPGPIRRLLRVVERSVAVVLDFIPLDHPSLYLVREDQRRAYGAALAALRRYGHYLPISRATAARLHALFPRSAGISDVTGVAIRDRLLPTGPTSGCAARAGTLIISGDDPRKNPDIVIAAHLPGTISFVGIHDKATRARLAEHHAALGGAPDALNFLPPLDDAALARAYATARLVIAPSRAEGFSMPVIEAIAQGAPVLAADEPAQAELITDPRDRFDPDDAATLGVRAGLILSNDTAWHEVRTRQSPVWHEFTTAAVAARFWAPLERPAAPAIRRHARPRIALLSPLPPTHSGCADHSAALLAALGDHADITAFSDTVSPDLPPGISFGGRADGTVMTSPRFDAMITVLGNSAFHRTEMRLLLDYGAAAILHDARMMGFYIGSWGAARARGVAAGELGRDVTDAELEAWELDQTTMPARFIGEIAAAATPLVVHAGDTARFVAARHGVHPIVLPLPPYRLPDPASLAPAGRAAARARLGIGADERLIVSFGHVHPGKDPTRTIDAFASLAAIGACRFALIGSGDPVLIETLAARAHTRGIPPGSIALGADQVQEAVYRDYLAAADAALQLRRAPPGSISGALMDVAAAGIPCVAAATLTDALDPPAYIHPIADDAEPAAIAAAIASLPGRDLALIAAQRHAFVEARSMARYARSLLDAVMS